MRFLVLIIVSLILAAGVIFVLLGQKKPAQQVQDGHFVLVSKIDIAAGTFVNVNDQLMWAEIAKGKFSADEERNFLRKAETDVLEFNGAVARNFIGKGQPVLRNKLVTPKDGGFMSAVLNPGMRAVSVGVNIVSGNAGFIFPGDRVDILLTHKVQDVSGEDSFATETFIENVRVLAIDQKINNPEKQAFVAKTVTLEVTPKQAEQILVAEELGKISLVLRSMGSATFADAEAIDAGEEINGQIAEPITLDAPILGLDSVGKAQTPTTKGYTRGEEVSKINRPRVASGTVTITRGRSTQTVQIEASGQTSGQATGQANPPTQAAN